jgi:hypothetical protein
MAARQQKSRTGIVAAASSSLLLSLCCTGTAFAAHNATSVDISSQSKDELAADELLTPAAKAALHSTLETDILPADGAKTPTTQTVVKQPDETENTLPDVSARIPGMSDNGLARFKRQMYRRDI